MADKAAPKEDFGLLMTWDQLKTECPELHSFLQNGFKFGVGGPDFEHLPVTKLNGSYEVIFYTTENEYHISARRPKNNDKGYLGCTCSSRTPLPGETWTRGSDLHDGLLTLETWVGILTDIVSNELVKLESQKEFEKMHKFAASQRENLLTVTGESK